MTITNTNTSHKIAKHVLCDVVKIKRLIKDNNRLLSLSSDITKNLQFRNNCTRINTLLNGKKYSVLIGAKN